MLSTVGKWSTTGAGRMMAFPPSYPACVRLSAAAVMVTELLPKRSKQQLPIVGRRSHRPPTISLAPLP